MRSDNQSGELEPSYERVSERVNMKSALLIVGLVAIFVPITMRLLLELKTRLAETKK
jgi:hypothetical protein